ncbi:MAG: antitoxin Xre/MbcA/ParS toxin-binding domain-containing protein [Spirochaeta sp.]
MSEYTIERLLGGTEIIGRSIHSEMDLYELGKTGIPKRSLLYLAGRINLSLRVISRILHVTERTIQRKNDQDRLNEALSEHIIQIAEVYSRGSEVFDTTDDFQVWAETVNHALGNKTPIELLSSRYGAQMVLDELGRIEHGVFA